MRRKIKDIIQSIKHVYQKLTRGFSDDELWSLDYSIAKFVLPRLKEFKKNPMHPADMTMEYWQDILDKMIKAMEYKINDVEGNTEGTREEAMDYKVGLFMFYYYFDQLWW